MTTKWLPSRGTIAAMLIFLAAGPAAGGHLDELFPWCWDDFVRLREPPALGHIPVGCEVVDCCPGCPGPPPELEWRVQIAGDPAAKLVLGFENLTRERARGLKVTGKGRLLADGSVEVGAGETRISGLPGTADGAPPVAIPKLTLGTGRRRTVRAAGASADGAADAPDGVDISIEQFAGPVVVNESHFLYSFRPCPRWPPFNPQDRIDLSGNTSSDNAVILVDGRRTGCTDDEIDRGNGTVFVGNLLAKQTCNAETAVFSDDNAVQIVSPVTVWTNGLGDVLPVGLAPLLNAPVTIWVLRGPFATVSATAATDVTRANQLYNTSNCGVGASATIRDATGNPSTPGLLNANCGNVAALQSQIGFTPGRLNAYYVQNPGARGWWCGNNTIIVGAGADNESFAHELGHAFSLDHTNGLAGISGANLMITGGTGRNNITEGQCFRGSLNAGSTLNTNGVRVGPTRSCPDGTTSATCPALSLDALPN